MFSVFAILTELILLLKSPGRLRRSAEGFHSPMSVCFFSSYVVIVVADVVVVSRLRHQNYVLNRLS